MSKVFDFIKKEPLKIVNFLILFFNISYIFGEYLNFNAFKNTGSIGALVFLIIFIFLDKKQALANLKQNYNENKMIIWLVGIVYFVIFSISCFPYVDNYPSVNMAFKNFRRVIILFLVALFWFDGDKKKSDIIFNTLIFTFVSCVLFYVIDARENLDQIFNNNEHIRVINRNFAFYFDILFAFGIIGFILFKNKIVKFILFSFLILGIIADILTGARGSWLANFLMIVLLLFLLYKNKSIKISKKMFFAFISSIVLFGSMLFVFYNNSALLKFKLSQTNSTGRDLILKKRLPLLFNSSRAFVGIGYGGEQYSKFLQDQNIKNEDLGPCGHKKDGTFVYWHDEPTFIAQYYHYGIFSLSFLVLVLVVFLKSLNKFHKENNYYILSICMSIFSYYIIRGLFEGFGIKYIMLYVCFYMFFNYKKEENRI